MNVTNKELFKRALSDAMNQKFEKEIYASRSESAICSTNHTEAIGNIIGISNKPIAKMRFSKRTIIAILVAVALLLTGCTVYMYRNEIWTWMEEIYEEHIRVTYDNDNQHTKENIDKTYSLTYIPDGYKMTNQALTPVYVLYEYTDDIGNTITFQQSPLDGTDFYLDAEQGQTAVVSIQAFDVYYREYNSSFHYLWTDNFFALSIVSSIELPTAELSNILEGMIITSTE